MWLSALRGDASSGLSLWVAGFAPFDAVVEGVWWEGSVAEWAGFHRLVFANLTAFLIQLRHVASQSEKRLPLLR